MLYATNTGHFAVQAEAAAIKRRMQPRETVHSRCTRITKMLTLFWISICLGFLPATEAYTSFIPNCTLPNATANYVSSPNTRGSLYIVWSCFATLIACVYAILYLNIPPRAEHVSPTQQRKLKNSHTLKGIFWSVDTLFAPEHRLAFAVKELLNARKQLKLLRLWLQGNAPEVECDWKLFHMFYANMGGFVLL